MIYAITGMGPRTGTSFVMGKVEEAGLPIFWSESMRIPGAKYDTHPKDMQGLTDVVVKVWPKHLSLVNISKMVILRRNYFDQVKSIIQQSKRERNAGFDVDYTPHGLIQESNMILSKTDIPYREYRTEELDDHIDEIVSWLSEPFEEAVKWA
jgi:hypothetical protein